ncbi:MAG: linear amide C-N hydrolase, partial [Candidatus Cloacimonetes bacterium]|nr:linear amide C-N hydrolase [Candidatus Cloacimonadota bacterium]
IVEIISETMPYEGVNNKGLFIGIAAVPNTKTPLSLFKPMRKSLEMVEVILQNASTVDEAIKIFSKYSNLFGMFLGNPVVHYKIVDISGESAVVEYFNKEIIVIRDEKKNQIITNHFLTDPSLEQDSKTSFTRFDIASEELQKSENYSIADIHNILNKVSQKSTVWSNVYDLSNMTLSIDNKQTPIVEINILEEIGKGKHGYKLEEIQGREEIEYSAKKSNYMFRPHFGYGILTTNGETVAHIGGRFLLNAGDKKWGLDVTYFNTENPYTSIGVILEAKPFNWFNASMGTIGYFGYGEDEENVIGYSTNLGWEPDNSIGFLPFVTYRSDMIFAKEFEIINSLSVGFGIKF